jgi:hypothetical protein
MTGWKLQTGHELTLPRYVSLRGLTLTMLASEKVLDVMMTYSPAGEFTVIVCF